MFRLSKTITQRPVAASPRSRAEFQLIARRRPRRARCSARIGPVSTQLSGVRSSSPVTDRRAPHRQHERQPDELRPIEVRRDAGVAEPGPHEVEEQHMTEEDPAGEAGQVLGREHARPPARTAGATDLAAVPGPGPALERRHRGGEPEEGDRLVEVGGVPGVRSGPHRDQVPHGCGDADDYSEAR